MHFGADRQEASIVQSQWPAETLDPTGATIRKTWLDIPLDAIFVSTSGSDTNSGDHDHPVRTINQALTLVNAFAVGTTKTVVYRAGTYTDSYTSGGASMLFNSGRFVHIQPYIAEDVIFDGEDTRTGWLSLGDSTGGGGQHRVRGVKFTGFMSNFGDQGHTPLYCSSGNGDNVTYKIEDNVFLDNDGCALNMQDPVPGTKVQRNVFRHNGAQALNSRGSGQASNPTVWDHENGMDVLHNYFGYNCWNPTYNWDAQMAGPKCLRHDGIRIIGNIVEYNLALDTPGAKAHGIWLDEINRHAVIAFNFVRGNGGAGIFGEVDYDVTAFSNISLDNGQQSSLFENIRMSALGGRMYNNTSKGGGSRCYGFYDDLRTITDPGSNCRPPDTADCEFVNNLGIGPTTGTALIRLYPDGTPHTGYVHTFPEDYVDPSVWSHNAMWLNGTANYIRVEKWSGNTDPSANYSLASLLSTYGLGGSDMVLTADPLVDSANGDYHVKSTSAAYQAATTLPSDLQDLADEFGVDTSNLSIGWIDGPVPSWA